MADSNMSQEVNFLKCDTGRFFEILVNRFFLMRKEISLLSISYSCEISHVPSTLADPEILGQYLGQVIAKNENLKIFFVVRNASHVKVSKATNMTRTPKSATGKFLTCPIIHLI